MNKNGKNSELFCILGCLNLHWQTSFGRNQQKPRQMKKREKLMNKNEHQIKGTTTLQNEKMKMKAKKRCRKSKPQRKNETNQFFQSLASWASYKDKWLANC